MRWDYSGRGLQTTVGLSNVDDDILVNYVAASSETWR